MKIVKSKYMPPFKKFNAINIMGIMFVHPDVHVRQSLIDHERIHTAQMRELLYVPFYLLYMFEWIARLPLRGNAYRNISFEREAYGNMYDPNYLNYRRHYSWIKYFGKKKRTYKKRRR